MKKLPIGLQSFRKIRESDYIYADKTEYIYNMIQSEGSVFLSRPRRFGKSLLVSTLEELFLGNRKLFEGLWIDSAGYEFTPYPVIHLDMSIFSSTSLDVFKGDLLLVLKTIAAEQGLRYEEASPGIVFWSLIVQLSEKRHNKVVVLIDEYDKPILDNLDTGLAAAMREELRGLYGVLKNADKYLRFVFMTGVSKFTKTSVFSGANQFEDITMYPNYANICGFEKAEFERLFSELLKRGANEREDELQQIYKWYDGYSWDGDSFIFNPFSVLYYFRRRQFKAFWYASGTPGFLINLIKNNPSRYTAQEPYKITENDIDAMDIDNLSLIPLLFQTGYLTIAHKPDNFGVYELRAPNMEVNEAFHSHLLTALSNLPEFDAPKLSQSILQALRDDKPESIQPMLVSLFSSIPYQLHVDAESYYHSIFYVLLKLMGAYISAEISVGLGRVDVVLKTTGFIYVMEWKYCKCDVDEANEKKQKLLNEAIEEARKQIVSKGYAKPFLEGGQKVIEVGVAVAARTDVLVRVFDNDVCDIIKKAGAVAKTF